MTPAFAQTAPTGGEPNCTTMSPQDLTTELAGSVLACSFRGPETNAPVYYNVYLPSGYAGSDNLYPVTYHLHGIGGSQGGNQNSTVPAYYEKEWAAGVGEPAIIVFPNGYIDSMWADSYDGSKPAETNLMPELINHIDANYRTQATRESRIIEGFSMGGFGAAKFAAKYPDLFATCIIYDGALHSWDSLAERLPEVARGIFNDNENYFNEYSPWTFVAQNADVLRTEVEFHMVVGALTDYGRSFRDYLLARDIPVDYLETGCTHALSCVLDTVSGAIGSASGGGSDPALRRRIRFSRD